MHTREEIFNTIKDILIKDFDCDESKIKIESNLVEDLDLDSIDAVDLVVKLQTIIDKKVDPEDFKQIRTLQDVVDAVEKIVNNNH
jgi:acyl carrier protein